MRTKIWRVQGILTVYWAFGEDKVTGNTAQLYAMPLIPLWQMRVLVWVLNWCGVRP